MIFMYIVYCVFGVRASWGKCYHTVPNSSNPNLVPVGDGFGFLFVFDDFDMLGVI